MACWRFHAPATVPWNTFKLSGTRVGDLASRNPVGTPSVASPLAQRLILSTTIAATVAPFHRLWARIAGHRLPVLW